MNVYIKAEVPNADGRDLVDRHVRYTSNQYGARLMKKSIADLDDISYHLCVDDCDTYKNYSKALARLLNEINKCDYVIEATSYDYKHGITKPMPVRSNYIDVDSDRDDSCSESSTTTSQNVLDLNDLSSDETESIRTLSRFYTVVYNGNNAQ
jgi:hypothetical protein